MTHLLLKRSNGAGRASAASPHVDFLSISNELQREKYMLSGVGGPQMERLCRFQERDLMEVGDYWVPTKGFKFPSQKAFYW